METCCICKKRTRKAYSYFNHITPNITHVYCAHKDCLPEVHAKLAKGERMKHMTFDKSK